MSGSTVHATCATGCINTELHVESYHCVAICGQTVPTRCDVTSVICPMQLFCEVPLHCSSTATSSQQVKLSSPLTPPDQVLQPQHCCQADSQRQTPACSQCFVNTYMHSALAISEGAHDMAGFAGVIQPTKEIGKLCRERKVFFHSDAAQAVGKIPINVNEHNIDLMSISGHKIYGPKGVGAVYVRRRPRVRLEPQMNGGGQVG